MDETTARRQRRFRPRDVRIATYCVVLCLVAAVWVGVLWDLLAPRPELHVVDGNVQIDVYTQSFIGADVGFAGLAVLAGVVVVVWVLWRWNRQARLACLIGAVAGSGIGALLAWRIGEELDGSDSGLSDVTAAGLASGTVFDGPLELQSPGMLLLWPILVCLVLAIANALAASRAAGRLNDLIDAQSAGRTGHS